MLTSANVSNVESSKLLKVSTNVGHLYILFRIWLLICPDLLFWQLNFTPAEIPQASLKTMAKNARRSMMSECKIHQIYLVEGACLAAQIQLGHANLWDMLTAMDGNQTLTFYWVDDC